MTIVDGETIEKVDRFSSDRDRALAAREAYLRYGDEQPSVERLTSILDSLHAYNDGKPDRQVFTGEVHLDLATHPEAPPEMVVEQINSAAELLAEVALRDYDQEPNRNLPALLRAELLLGYLPKYRRKLVDDQEPTIEDEAQLAEVISGLYSKPAVEAGSLPGKSNDKDSVVMVRGMLFELGIHLLNARRNLRYGRVLAQMWPSLPRQERNHTVDLSGKRNFDAAISRLGLFEPDNLRLQLKAVDNSGEGDEESVYDPSIVKIVGETDLGTKYSAEILASAHQSLHLPTARERAVASIRLSNFEEAFIRKIKLGAATQAARLWNA